MAYKINHADILNWAKNYDGEPFDGILCDPPYELGFMGKSWDSTGIAFNVELWTELLRICKPGAHLLAFSGSRTYHRMACAIEDAGFEIRDMIEWVYGSGFPKSLNIGKAVDKIEGNEREVVGTEVLKGNAAVSTREKGGTFVAGASFTGVKEIELTKGTSEWEGYGTALKPAHEPCVLARKPIKGTVANNCLEHGTGGLNIDGSRVKSNGDHKRPFVKRNTKNSGEWEIKSGIVKPFQPTNAEGRFPANLIHDGSDEVLEVFPDTKSQGHWSKTKVSGFGDFGGGKSEYQGVGNKAQDSGSAARFFYTAKASKSERNAGLDGFPKIHSSNTEDSPNPKRDIRPNILTANHHPTVKPLSLTKYLATLIKPPTGGRLLVPFSGSGSEMIGALQAGWEYVEGVELTEEYIPIAEARIKHWLDKIDKQMEIL